MRIEKQLVRGCMVLLHDGILLKYLYTDETGLYYGQRFNGEHRLTFDTFDSGNIQLIIRSDKPIDSKGSNLNVHNEPEEL